MESPRTPGGWGWGGDGPGGCSREFRGGGGLAKYFFSGPKFPPSLRRVLETAFEKVLRRVLGRCLAVGFRAKKGSEKGF